MKGKILGINLFLDEIICLYEPPYKKEWQTVGNINLLVIGHYKMGIEITPDKSYSKLKVYIDYSLPKGLTKKLMGILFSDFYARLCVRQMLIETHKRFIQ